MTFWSLFPVVADAVQIFTVCRPSWVNSLYFHIILAFWSNPTFWQLFPVFADAAKIAIVCRPSWVNLPYFFIVLGFWSNPTFWPLFPVQSIRPFTVCRPSWVNSPRFRMILAFLSNLTFWPPFPVLADAPQIFTVCKPLWVNSPYSIFWPIFSEYLYFSGNILVKSRILRNSTFWPMSRFRISGCQICFPQEIMYLWRACEN